MRWFTASKRPRGVALLLVSLALSACGLGGIHVSSSAEPTATPGAPTLMIRLDFGNDERGVGLHAADYLSDGTVIRVSVVGAGATLERNTLTEAGLATLRAVLDKDADLLAQPGEFKSDTIAGSVQIGYGDWVDTFVLEHPDGSRYTVLAPAFRSPNASNWAPDPDIDRLTALAKAMLDPVTLVGAGGLVDPGWKPYQPAKMAMFVSIGEVDPQFVAESLAPDISATGWPFEGNPGSFGMAYSGPSGVDRCGFVSSADALAFTTSLPRSAGGTLAADRLASGATFHSGTLLWLAKSPVTAMGVFVVALLPEDAAASCADVLAY